MHKDSVSAQKGKQKFSTGKLTVGHTHKKKNLLKFVTSYVFCKTCTHKDSPSTVLLTGSCAVVGLGGRAADPLSSLAVVPSLELFLLARDLDCWALAAWVFTEWRS